MSSLRTKLFGGFATLLAASLMVAGTVMPAQATEDPTVVSARSFLAKFGADQATQDRLIDTYLAGGSWDSLTSSTPVAAISTRRRPR